MKKEAGEEDNISDLIDSFQFDLDFSNGQ